MEDEKCYVFDHSRSRPSKRQKVEASGLDASRPIRDQIYQELWSKQNQRLQAVLDDANRATLDQLVAFLHQESQTRQTQTIRAAFVIAGPDTSVHSTFFEQLGHRLDDEPSYRLVTLHSAQCPNLKTLLKTLIRTALDPDAHHHDNDDQDKFASSSLLDYDLEAVVRSMRASGQEKLVVAISDSEAFPAHVLSEFIHLSR
jgi:origin recognition complex subunit 3